MTINDAFGKIVEAYLKEKGMTKAQFIEEAKISRRNLYRILNGQTSPSLDTICLIAEAMGISPGKLVSKANSLRKG